MLKPIQNLSCLIVLGLLVSAHAFAFGRSPIDTTSQPCFNGSSDKALEQAQNILYSVTNIANPPGAATVESLFPGGQHLAFTAKLHDAMQTVGCAFIDDARFDTFSEVLNSIAFYSYKIAPSDAPKFLKPGFKAIIGGYDSDNTLFIETTTDGFIFHACEPDPQTGPGVDLQPLPPSPACPTLLNGAIFIPVDELLKTTSGIKAALLTVIKAIGSLSVIVTSDLSLSIATPVAQAASTILTPDPIDSYENDHSVDVAISDMMRMGARRDAVSSKDDPNAQIITRLLPYKYADLKSAMIDILGKSFSHEYDDLTELDSHPEDPNLEALPALGIERNFRNRMVKAYNAAVQPSPSPSAAPAPVPAPAPATPSPTPAPLG